MSNLQENRYLLGSAKFKSSPNVDFSYKVPLSQTFKQNVEFDRTADVDLQQIFDNERQASTIFRPACKFTVLFKNSYVGKTNYVPFENNLYYLNAAEAAAAQCQTNSSLISWSGLPQYNEFDFIRTDYDVSGYTQPPNNHLLFIPSSASSYNWNFFLSYPYENDFNKTLQTVDKVTSQTIQWNSGDGIPFVIELIQIDGKKLVSFRCPFDHGLSVGEFVALSFNYNNDNIFKVDSLGNGFAETEQFIFNIDDIGYTGLTFFNGRAGTARRVILENQSADTKSIYYVRKNKILTNLETSVVTKAGFEENLFGVSKKYESSGFTPNYTARVSVKEGAQSYTVSFNKDVNIGDILDNLGRPISQLFFTVIWSGYFGWTRGTLKQGFKFNLPEGLTPNAPSAWWNINNTLSNTNLPTGTWTNASGNTFSYVLPLKEGDIIDGHLCEWNYFEQKERIISSVYHKFTFNPTYFNIGGLINSVNPLGYYYEPHYLLQIKEYSDYIETAEPSNVVGIPNYAYYSSTLNEFLWRDLYPYGFIESTAQKGVNYPFLNGGHYPFGNFVFRLVPEGTNLTQESIVSDPTIDGCE